MRPASCSNAFEVEDGRRDTGRLQSFPEVDRAEWLNVDTARSKLVKTVASLSTDCWPHSIGRATDTGNTGKPATQGGPGWWVWVRSDFTSRRWRPPDGGRQDHPQGGRNQGLRQR